MIVFLILSFACRLKGPCQYLWLDAMNQQCRGGGRVAKVAVVMATGVNADGCWELLGPDVFASEDQAG
jgi:transposase-like protein